ncbi:MAG: hypothetical protein D6784_00705, partial [Chloroflexi bacterium]
MAQLFDRMVAFYQRINWPMTAVPDETILSVTYQGDRGQWVFVASVDEPRSTVTMFARAPLSCPPEKFCDLAEFIERANFGMTHGAWVVDRRDGEIRFRVGIDMTGLELTDTCLQNMTIYTNLTMDFYLPGLRALLEEGMSPEAAYNLVFSQ